MKPSYEPSCVRLSVGRSVCHNFKFHFQCSYRSTCFLLALSKQSVNWHSGRTDNIICRGRVSPQKRIQCWVAEHLSNVFIYTGCPIIISWSAVVTQMYWSGNGTPCIIVCVDKGTRYSEETRHIYNQQEFKGNIHNLWNHWVAIAKPFPAAPLSLPFHLSSRRELNNCLKSAQYTHT